MKLYRIRAGAALPVILPLFLAACASQLSGSVGSAGQADFNTSVALRPRMAALIRSMAAMTGSAPAEEYTIDGAAIAASMSGAPGIASVSLRNTSPIAIEGPVRISRISDFLNSRQGGDFINFEQSPSGGRLRITLACGSGPQLLALLSPQIAEYLGALMAPLATGELLTTAEYLALVSAVYGKALADEISQSSIDISLDFPGQVRSVQGGSFSGRRVNFAIPLVKLLVLETPLNYEIRWTPAGG
jgi:hypothetical protein